MFAELKRARFGQRLYNHHAIAWIKAYLLCLGEHRPVVLLHPMCKYGTQLSLEI